MNFQTDTITQQLVADTKRLDITEQLFGVAFPLMIEPMLYGIADRLSADYNGGYWQFYTLSNGGFYMAPESDQPFQVVCDMNYFEGNLSADVFGIVCCLYAYSHLSFSDNQNLSQLCAKHYHWLRDFVIEHDESGLIFAATD